MLLYAMMVMMRDDKMISEVKPKAIISVDLVSEQERWIRAPISQKK
jgi:hypothetical protein